MKKLITYLALIICIYANAQSDKVNIINEELTKVENDWRETVDKQLKQLQAMSVVLYKLQNNVNNLTERLNHQSDQITQLTIKGMRDSLKIEGLENRIEYTQSFIKDSVYFALANVDPIETNLLGDVNSLGEAWTNNDDLSYNYNHTISNYSVIRFNLTEKLKPNSTYIISFNIKLSDINRPAILKVVVPTASGTDITVATDAYYSNDNYTLELQTGTEICIGLALRARNNDGGSFKLVNPKIEEKR